MRLLVASLLALACIASVNALPSASELYDLVMSNSFVFHPKSSDLTAFLKTDTDDGSYTWKDSSSMGELRRRMIPRIRTTLKSMMDFMGVKVETLRDSVDAAYYPFRWIPMFQVNVVPGAAPVSFSSPCFPSMTAQAVKTTTGTFNITVTTGPQSSWFCSEFYLLTSLSGLSFQSYASTGAHTFEWTLPTGATKAEVFDVENHGIRVMRFLGGFTDVLGYVWTTLEMFASELSTGVDAATQAINIAFIGNYSGFSMPTRTTNYVPIDESVINSGDFFGIVRMDGLDPMLAWAMGSTTGHTTIALRVNGTLMVCESTSKDSYWPINGVQCNTYAKWIEMAQAADYQVVHAPLSAAMSAKFDSDKAWAYFKSVEGFDYGYHSLLWGWIDTLQDNYVCLPPDYVNCLTWETVEVLFGLMDHFVPAVGEVLFNEAFNKRLGTKNLLMADLMQYATQHNIPHNTIPTLVEMDSWMYNTTRNGVVTQGPAMVCCVFVCQMWKNSGMFGDLADQFQCAEMTNWDDYVLTIFNTDYASRPQQCKTADPLNKDCQIMGKNALVLNNYNSKKPYKNMANSCPSLAPNYPRPLGC